MDGILTEAAVEKIADSLTEQMLAFVGIRPDADNPDEIAGYDALFVGAWRRWRRVLGNCLLITDIKIVEDFQCCFPVCQVEEERDEMA